MEFFVSWIEKRKRYLMAIVFAIVIATFFLPERYRDLALILRGLAWNIGHAESASIFWIRAGFSPELSQRLAIVSGMIGAWIFCGVGFSVKKIPHNRFHGWLAHHTLVSKIPYLAIIVLGLCAPIGGVVLGILIAQVTGRPKLPAMLTILGTNLVKLYWWGKLIHSLAF